MIEFTQMISDRDYKKAIAKHYFGYKYTYISPILGLLILLCLLTLHFVYKGFFHETSIFLYLLAFFMLFRPILYIKNVFNSFKTSKFFSNEVYIKITDDAKLMTNGNGIETSINLADLYAYYNTKIFLFLYLSRNHYIIIDKRQLNNSDVNHVVHALDSFKIKKR
jgi:hypothetical protein